jgi:hypothetical protein
MLLDHNISGGKKGMLELWDGDYDKWQVDQLFTWTYINQTTTWLVHNWNIFGAWTSHGHTWTHNTHHGRNSGETITFPLIGLFVINHWGYIQISFCHLEILDIETPATLQAMTFYMDIQLKWSLKQSCSPH